MARLKRIVVPGYPHHVVQRGVRSMDIFFNNHDRQEYLRLLKEQGQRFGVHYISYCLMNNHVHLIAIPENPESLAKAIGESHRRYTRMINFRDNVRGFLFQGRFYSCPVHIDNSLLATVRYVERNPARAKMVTAPWDYQWSSAKYRVGLISHDPLITRSPLLSGVKNWQQFLTTEPDFDNELREKYRTGRPFGPAEFYDIVEKITGKDALPKRPGRPKNSNVSPDKT